MRCPACATERPPGARFCPGCGAAAAAGCTGCGAPLVPGARFCASCGARVPASPAAPTAPAPEGENRVVTVLFADMAGSVRAVAGLEAEEAARVVNRLLATMVEAVKRYGGTVDRFLGDGVLAVFGAPTAHEDDPDRAVNAGLDIRDAVAALGFSASVGINTGEVYSGRMGSEAHRETTVMGPAVNVAARLQAGAGGGRVLMGEATQRATRRAFDAVAVEVSVKGLDAPVRAFEVHGRADGSGKPLGDRRSPLVGRVDELARLVRASEGARGGRGHVVTLVGEAGVGKSRLTDELRRAAPDLRWMEGRSAAMTSGTSYGPFVDILRTAFDCGTTLPDKEVAARILAGFERLVEEGAWEREAMRDAAPLIARLLSVPLGEPWDAAVGAATPAQLRTRTFLALRAYFGAVARRGPLVVVLEDLHWADDLTLALVPDLLETFAERPVLVILTYRPERDHGCARLAEVAASRCPGRHADVTLRELPPDESIRLVRGLLGADAPAEVDALILARAQGNPLFVEEVVRSLVDAGLVARSDGSWVKGGDASAVRVPENVQSVILSRVDTLDESSRAVLQAASVFGRVFRPEMIARVVDGMDVRRALRAIEDRGLAFPARLVPDEEWTFKHALTQETVYRSLLKPRRAALHDRAVTGIETETPPDALDQRYEELAHHADLGTDGAKAVHYLLKAGAKARAAFLNDAALARFRRALERLDAGDHAGTEARRVAHEGLADIHALTGRPADALLHIDAALEDVSGTSSVPRARLLRKRANAHMGLRHYEGITIFDEARAALGPEGWRASDAAASEWIEIDSDLCWALYWTTDWRSIAPVVERSTPAVEARATPAQRARWLFCRTLYELRRTRFDVGDLILRLYRDAFLAGEESRDPAIRALTNFGQGVGLLWHGDEDAAEPFLVTGLDLAERIGDVVLKMRALVYLGAVSRRRGDADRAATWAGSALALSETLNAPEYIGAAEGVLSWVAWRRGDAAEARRRGLRAIEMFRNPVPAFPFRWYAASVLLDLDVAAGDLAGAATWATTMLDPTQQVLPQDLTAALQESAQTRSQPRFLEALALHRRERHL